MKVAVFGAGAIGAFVGAWLQESGHEVLFIGRQRLLDEINANDGILTARNLDGKEIRISPNYATAPESLKHFEPDLILIALKSDATRGACEDIARILKGSPKIITVVSMQNGATNPVTMREILPSGAFVVLGGMVGFNVAIQPKGLYVQGTQGHLIVEDTGDKRGVTAAQVSEAFVKAGLPSHVDSSDEFKPVVYGKLCTNLGNAVNALSGVPVLTMLQTRSFRKVIAQLYRESLSVLRAHGIEPKTAIKIPMGVTAYVMEAPDVVFQAIVGRAIKVNAHAKSSMLEDVQQGRPTEVAHLQGHIIKLASELDPPIPVPFNEVCLRLVQDWEKGDRKTPPKIEGEDLWKLGLEEARKQGVSVDERGLVEKAGWVAGLATAIGLGYFVVKRR